MNGASRGTHREDAPGAPLAVAPRILLADDDPSVCALLQAQLARRGFEVQPALSVSEALRLLEDTEIEVVLTDIVMEGMDGLQLCAQVVAERPELPVVILTASERLETAIGAMRAGAYDFVTKPIDLEVLTLALERAVKKRRLVAAVERLSRALEEATGFDELVGESPVMRKVYGLLGRVAQSEASVLITGESGTGKELVARALHRRGLRCHPGDAARERALRTPARRVHRRVGGARGSLRAGERRNPVPRRNRRPADRPAAKVDARTSGARRPSRRRQGRSALRRAPHHRHEPGSACRGRRAPLPGGPLLPRGRHPDRAATPAGAWHGRAAARPALRRAVW